MALPTQTLTHSHSNCSSAIAIDKPGLALPRRLRHHGNREMVLHQYLILQLHVSPKRYKYRPDNSTTSPVMSESFIGVDPGTNGRANTRLPRGSTSADAMNDMLAEPNLHTRT